MNMRLPQIYILTRTSQRPHFFHQNYLSIKAQNYPHITQLVSYDDENTYQYVKNYATKSIGDSNFKKLIEEKFDEAHNEIEDLDENSLEELIKDELNDNIEKTAQEEKLYQNMKDDERGHEVRIFKMERNEKGYQNGAFPYNLYLNELMKQMDKPGWILILDDDDLLVDHAVILKIVSQIVSNHLNTDEHFLAWQVEFPNGRLVPKNIGRRPKIGDVSMIGFMFHSMWKNIFKFENRKGGDFLMMKKISKTLKPHWIPEVLTKINYDNIRRIGSGLRNDLKFTTAQNKEYNLFLDNKMSKVKPVINLIQKTDPRSKLKLNNSVPTLKKKSISKINLKSDVKSEENSDEKRISLNISDFDNDPVPKIKINLTGRSSDDELNLASISPKLKLTPKLKISPKLKLTPKTNISKVVINGTINDSNNNDPNNNDSNNNNDPNNNDSSEISFIDQDKMINLPLSEMPNLSNVILDRISGHENNQFGDDHMTGDSEESDDDELTLHPTIVKLLEMLSSTDKPVDIVNYNDIKGQLIKDIQEQLVPVLTHNIKKIVELEVKKMNYSANTSTGISSTTGSQISADKLQHAVKNDLNIELPVDGGKQIPLTMGNLRNIHQTHMKKSIERQLKELVEDDVTNNESRNTNNSGRPIDNINNYSYGNHNTLNDKFDEEEEKKLSQLIVNYAQDTEGVIFNEPEYEEKKVIGTTLNLGEIAGGKNENNEIDLEIFEKIFIINTTGQGELLKTQLELCGFVSQNIQILDSKDSNKKNRTFMSYLLDTMKISQKKSYKKIAVFQDNIILSKNFRQVLVNNYKKICKNDWKMVAVSAEQNLVVNGKFDWEFYLDTYTDLRKAGIDDETKALKHWKKNGKRERRFMCEGVPHPDSLSGMSGLFINSKFFKDVDKLKKARNPYDFILRNYKNETFAFSPLLALSNSTRRVKMKNRSHLSLYE